jgi:hypothetical protein
MRPTINKINQLDDITETYKYFRVINDDFMHGHVLLLELLARFVNPVFLNSLPRTGLDISLGQLLS